MMLLAVGVVTEETLAWFPLSTAAVYDNRHGADSGCASATGTLGLIPPHGELLQHCRHPVTL